jgi:hypothetical protein
MSDAAAFKATYSDFRLVRSRKVVQLVFEVPLEKSADALACLGGMPNPAAETWCAIARLDLDKAEQFVPEIARPNKLAQLIGIRCNDKMFWQFLMNRYRVIFSTNAHKSSEIAAEFVRDFCKVESRADIQGNPEAALRWDLLESSFICWRDAPELADA